jgi:tRNA-splicing ligase RtcB
MDLTFGSTAHGAGRTMSRAAAKRMYHSYEAVKNELESKGIYVKALTGQGLLEDVRTQLFHIALGSRPKWLD